MRLVACVLALLVLLMILGFCIFGFLATFEPPGWPELRVVYAGGALLALVLGGWMTSRGMRKE